jgi:hypothetical protein
LHGFKDFDVSDVSRELSVLFPKKAAEKLAFLYLLDEKEELNELLKLSEIRKSVFKKPFLPPPDHEESFGKITLGSILKGDRVTYHFCIDLEDLNRHVAIFSSTGMGKTTLIINILLQLLQNGKPIPFLAIDWKRDLRHLIRKHPILVLRWEWLKINFFQPPEGVSEKQWMMIVADIFAHVFGFFSASENYLLDYMDQLYRKHKGEYPTLRELFEAIDKSEEKSRRYSEYRDVVRNRLASMLIVLKDVVDCRVGFPIEELLNHPVVIELDGLRRDEANFLVEYILAYVFAYRIANGHRGNLRHCIIFDEATRLFYKKKEWRETTIELGIPFIETVPQIIRDYGEGIIFALQEPSMASHSLMANSNVKIIGFLGEGGDIDAIARSLDLSDEERSVIPKLERGEWLVKKAGMNPFLLKSFDYPLEKNVTDEELLERMQPFLSKLSGKVIPVYAYPQRDRQRVQLPKISEESEKLLFNVNEHPFTGLSTRYKMLGLSGRKAEAAKRNLIQKELIKEVEIALGSYRPVKFLCITKLGLDYLKHSKQDTKLWDYVGRVGFEHRLYQILIAYSMRRIGYQAFIEKEVNGIRFDVLALSNGRRVGIEVELKPTVNLSKILKSMKEIDELIIVCKDRSTLEKVRETIERVAYASLRERMEFFLVKEYLARLSNGYAHRKGKNSDCSKRLVLSSNPRKKLGKKEKNRIE